MADPSSESVKMFISRTAGVIEEVEEVVEDFPDLQPTTRNWWGEM
jgi:hypothetical protein